MKHLSNEQGVALVFELLLVVVVLALVSGAVYVARHHKNAQTVAKASITPSITPSSVPPSPSASSSPAVSTTPILVIRELGVAIPLSTGLDDLEYTYTPATPKSPAHLHFSTDSIVAMPGGSHCVPANDPLGDYTVYSSIQSNVGSGDNQVGVFVVSVNGYNIYYHHAQYACGLARAILGVALFTGCTT